jgi:prevent-host-death family protein
MPMTKVASTDFHQRTGEFVDRALMAPIAITKRGRPSLVLMSFEEYKRLTGRTQRAMHVSQMSDEDIAILEDTRMDPKYDYLNEELD